MTERIAVPRRGAKPSPPEPESHAEMEVAGESREETVSDEKAAKALQAIAEVSAKLPRNG
jgi:hypothetical protein